MHRVQCFHLELQGKGAPQQSQRAQGPAQKKDAGKGEDHGRDR